MKIHFFGLALAAVVTVATAAKETGQQKQLIFQKESLFGDLAQSLLSVGSFRGSKKKPVPFAKLNLEDMLFKLWNRLDKCIQLIDPEKPEIVVDCIEEKVLMVYLGNCLSNWDSLWNPLQCVLREGLLQFFGKISEDEVEEIKQSPHPIVLLGEAGYKVIESIFSNLPPSWGVGWDADSCTNVFGNGTANEIKPLACTTLLYDLNQVSDLLKTFIKNFKGHRECDFIQRLNYAFHVNSLIEGVSSSPLDFTDLEGAIATVEETLNDCDETFDLGLEEIISERYKSKEHEE